MSEDLSLQLRLIVFSMDIVGMITPPSWYIVGWFGVSRRMA